jgi:tetratricopeptide (TPR) repeat protein
MDLAKGAVDARRRWLVALALVAACLFVYGQAVSFGFLNFDDNGYVTENQWVRPGLTAAGVRWAFTAVDYYYWQPLTWLSHMIDCQLFGLRPGWHHLTSLLFHIANTLLLFGILLRLTAAFWRSALVAAIFALHPTRIESVVWIAERKDLLSGFFFLAAIWCYLRYAEQPSRGRYCMVIAAFVLGLMSKPMVMMLPLILLLLDWWPLGRRAFAEKLPMFMLAGFSSFVTSIGTVRLSSINWGSSFSLGQRIANALISYVRYLELSFWPHDLAILYPFRTAVPPWQTALAALLLAAITALALWQARRRPYLIVGWLWFTFGLFPASGVVTQVGWQGMADRFTYLPHIGLAIAVIWGVADLLGTHRGAAAALSGTAVALFAIAAMRQVPVWRDSVTVFAHAVAVTGGNPAAQHYLAAALDDRGQFDAAFLHHAEAARLEPYYLIMPFSYGVALERRGQTAAAIEQFQRVLVHFPNHLDAQRHIAENRQRLGLSKGLGLKQE